MFAYIRGLLTESAPGKIAIEANGIGYRVFVPVSLNAQLPSLGSELIIHVSFVVREFSQTLYGFLHQQERELFEALLNVSGIGPKIALSIISHLTVAELLQAMQNKDIQLICKVPGIGKKTAERMLIELKDKIAGAIGCCPDDFAIKLPPADPKMQTVNDAMSALINLGYTQVAAQKAVKKTMDEHDELDLSNLIAKSLKHI